MGISSWWRVRPSFAGASGFLVGRKGQDIGKRVFPSWDRRGGRAIKKISAKPPLEGAAGVVSYGECVSTAHPVCAFIRWLRKIFLIAQPPLLFQEGNTLAS
jgi:hypothetical protein